MDLFLTQIKGRSDSKCPKAPFGSRLISLSCFTIYAKTESKTGTKDLILRFIFETKLKFGYHVCVRNITKLL